MISYLKGTIKIKGSGYVIVLVGGVGYKVFVPQDLLSSLKIDKPFSIFTYTHVREDVLNLYGFSSQEDLALFELFLKVSGIGPKLALSIFASAKVEKIKQAIIKGDVEFFTSIPRLGKKNAQKIIIELRSKLGSLDELDLTYESDETKQIVEALKSFGFNIKEAKEAVKATREEKGNTSDKIRQALKWLGKK